MVTVDVTVTVAVSVDVSVGVVVADPAGVGVAVAVDVTVAVRETNPLRVGVAVAETDGERTGEAVTDATTVAVVVGTLALVVGVPGLFLPRILKPIFVSWMILVFPIGWLVSHIVLFLIYWSVFVPFGFILRRMGHDPLRLRKPAVESYWEQKTQQTKLRRYLKQF